MEHKVVVDPESYVEKWVREHRKEVTGNVEDSGSKGQKAQKAKSGRKQTSLVEKPGDT